MRPNPPIIRPVTFAGCHTQAAPASTMTGPRGSPTGLNSAFAPPAPLERWICYTQSEIVNLRSDLIQYQQTEIVNLRNDLIKYRQQFADYQKICQSQLDVLTQQVRQSHQTLTGLQRSIIDLQNTQTEFARNIEDIYRKLISLSSQLHGRSVPETQTVPPAPIGGVIHPPPEDAPTQRSPCPAAQQYHRENPSESLGQSLSNYTTNPYGAITHRAQTNSMEYGPSPAPRALMDIFDLSTQPY